MKSNLNLTHLQNFIQVVEWGNVSRAATYLNIAQPALSRQIQLLEQSLGTSLLRRQNRGVEPTEDGKLLLEHARRIQRECMAAQESVRANRENPTGPVFFGVPSAYSVSLVPPLIERMRDRYPNISVHVVDGFTRAIYEWLIGGRLDLAILYHSKEQSLKRSSPFLEEQLMALTAPQTFAEVSEMDHAKLADKTVITSRQPHFLRQALDTNFTELGAQFVPKYEIDSMRCMIEMAQRGDGAIILPPSSVGRELSEGRLKSIRIDSTFQLRTVIAHAPGRRPTRSTGILTQELQMLAAELATEKGWSVATPEPD